MKFGTFCFLTSGLREFEHSGCYLNYPIKSLIYSSSHQMTFPRRSQKGMKDWKVKKEKSLKDLQWLHHQKQKKKEKGGRKALIIVVLWHSTGSAKDEGSHLDCNKNHCSEWHQTIVPFSLFKSIFLALFLLLKWWNGCPCSYWRSIQISVLCVYECCCAVSLLSRDRHISAENYYCKWWNAKGEKDGKTLENPYTQKNMNN